MTNSLDPNSIAQSINTLADFCAQRDFETLTQEEIQAKTDQNQVDVLVLFGGTIVEGLNVLAKAIENQVARTTVIVGGAGHTTNILRKTFASLFEDDPAFTFETLKGLSEAEIFQKALGKRYGLQADFLETRSSNCGNNITFLLDLLKEKNIPCKSIVLCQDGTMQHRMQATLKKEAPEMKIYNFATYQVHVHPDGQGGFALNEHPEGMWTVDRYVELLCGEISRLKDDENGYGPKGKNYIAHVDIPEAVEQAFKTLQKSNLFTVRQAQTQFKDPFEAIQSRKNAEGPIRNLEFPQLRMTNLTAKR